MVKYLLAQSVQTQFPMCDFERMRYELRTGDVLLVEGRSRISGIIRYLTQSSWAHSALYIGKIHDIDDVYILWSTLVLQ